MNKNQKFLLCKHCGNLVDLIHNAGAALICCGEEMTELAANTQEAGKEKHLPVIHQNGNEITVQVGSLPMTQEHSIQWIYLETQQGGQRKVLFPDQQPVLSFTLKDDKAIAAYAYCNLHGLWKTEI